MKQKDIKRLSLEYIFIFLLVLFLGQATVYTHGGLDSFALSNTEDMILSLIGKAFMLFMSILLVIRYKINLFKPLFCSVVLVLLLWGTLQYLKYFSFPVTLVSRLISFYFVVVIISVYKLDFLKYFEDICVKLTIISLILWGLLLMMPAIINNIGELSPIKGDGMIQYSFGIWGTPSKIDLSIPRNCGFAWEPGRFGCILSFVLLINLYRTKFVIKGNKNFYFLLAGIISTLSTTAFGCVGAIAIIYLYNKSTQLKILMFPIIALAGYYVYQLDFIGTKITELWGSDYIYDQIVYYGSTGEVFTPQRFDAIMLEAYNIIHDPLIGNAGDQMGYLLQLFGANMSLSNGVLRIFANMGIFIGLWYYIQLYKSSNLLKKIYGVKSSYAFFIIFVMMNFSYAFLFDPLFLSVILYPYFYKRKLILYAK